jgi:hypothetical protein
MGSEFEEYRVQDLIAQGRLAIGDGYRAKNNELARAGLPFARVGNVNDGFHFDDCDCFPEADLSRVGDKISQPGDVVFTSKGTVGRFAFVRPDTPRFVYSPQLCYWRALDAELIDPLYLFYWMCGPDFLGQYKGVAGQTDMAEYVSLADQRSMRLTLPPIDRQRAVARILGALDDKIELNRRMSHTLESMARASFKSWFVDIDATRADEAEVGWRVGRLSDVAELLRKTENPLDHPTETFMHYSLPAFDAGRRPVAETGRQIKSLKFQVPPDAVLVSKLNPEIERVWLVDAEPADHSVCSTEFLVLRARKPYGRAFLYCLTRSPGFRTELESLVTGTSRSHQRVQPDSFLGIATRIPPASLAAEFDRTPRQTGVVAARYRHGCAANHLVRPVWGASRGYAIDTRIEDADTVAMVTKTKRTYNLNSTTVDHVRELAERSGVARSQDGVVELAVERFYLEVRAREEASMWEAAANDPSFTAEMKGIAHDFRDGEVWPA